jgi:hypothetical protein
MNPVKYPRTIHLPYSDSVADDDIVRSDDHLKNKEVIVTLKLDGENTSLYNNYYHARSIDSANHVSRDFVKSWWMERSYNLPENMRICGENLFAKHSIYYANLKHYFYGFSVWEDDICLSWEDTLEWFSLFDITPVEVIYRGVYDKESILNAFEPHREQHEGFVIRRENAFKYNEFKDNMAKYVRKNHVNSDKHWMHQTITPNKLEK